MTFNADTSVVEIEKSAQVAYKFYGQNHTQLALQDMFNGIRIWQTWFMLAYQDIKLRYRRSVLGPFWITISMAITVYTMGYLYSHLFRSDLKTYFPFVTAGMLAWALISSTITDLSDAFITAEGLIKQIKLPYTLYIHRLVIRNIIIFLHNSLVMLPIIIFFHDAIKINFYTLLIIPGLFLFYVNAFFYGLAIAMVGARFRDLSQIIKSLVQVTFFITPVMWSPSILPANKRFIADFNPVYSFIELIRAPLLGAKPVLLNWLLVLIMTVIGAVLSFLIFKRYRSRIVYWL